MTTQNPRERRKSLKLAEYESHPNRYVEFVTNAEEVGCSARNYAQRCTNPHRSGVKPIYSDRSLREHQAKPNDQFQA